MPLPMAIQIDRAAEQAFMKQSPPTLVANIIRKVRAYLSIENHFVIDFENFSRRYSFVITLLDRSALSWRECQAVADCMRIAARGGAVDADAFAHKCDELGEKYSSAEPKLANGRAICAVHPGIGSVGLKDGDTISRLSLLFDDDGDLSLEAHTHAAQAYSVCLALPTTGQHFYRKDCRALGDVLRLLEPGAVVGRTAFLVALATLRRRYNYVRLTKSASGKLKVIITASAVPNSDPLHPAIQWALDRRDAASPARSAPSGAPRCPYPGLRYTRALKRSGQAQVYAGVDERGRKIAIKVFTGGAECAAGSYRTELRMLLKMRAHRNVIEVLEFFETPQPALVTRLIDGAGDLREFLQRNGRVQPGEAQSMAAELADGIVHLHKSGIVHRDLKSANVLLRKSGRTGKLSPVIIDLGLGSAMRGRGAGGSASLSMDQLESAFGERAVSEQTDATKGTVFWMAPEMITRQEWSEKTDVFAFGVIFWELLSGCTPYSHVRFRYRVELLRRIAQGERPDMREVKAAHVHQKKMIEKCWSTDPMGRPTMQQVLDVLRMDDPVAIFESLDKNGDNTLNFSEFVQFLERYAPTVRPAKMYTMFQAIDKDNSGDITLQEFLKFWRTLKSSFAQRKVTADRS